MNKLIFFDNTVVKKLLEQPKYWNSFSDNFFVKFGESIRPLYSYYLFFEYFGLKKEKFLNISSSPLKFQKIKQINEIGLTLDNYFEHLCDNIKNQLSMNTIKGIIEIHINQRTAYRSYFDGSNDLYKILFQKIIELFYSDYNGFIEQSATFLAWDYLCDINPEYISIEKLREIQLNIWLQLHDLKVILPFGKIIDDISPFKLIKNSKFKGGEDMVDSEALTYLLMGYIDEHNIIEPVNILTYDNPINWQQRIQLGSAHLNYINNVLNKKLNNKVGKIYCLHKNAFMINQVYEPEISILL